MKTEITNLNLAISQELLFDQLRSAVFVLSAPLSSNIIWIMGRA